MTSLKWQDNTVEQRERALPARSLGDLLNETFVIYAKHLWRFIALVAVVQVPVAVVAQLVGDGPVAYGFKNVLWLIGSAAVYGAVVFAVCQQYVTGAIGFRQCYQRVRWRLVSLTLLALSVGLVVAIVASLIIVAIYAISILAFLCLLGLLVYWSVAVQAVVIEGHRPVRALRRSFGLIRGSWWRVLAITAVVVLVVMGLGLVLQAPFAVASWVAAPESPTAFGNTLQFLGSVLVGVVVPPVAGIASTLIYYDLRVRKEQYNFAMLSREMGMAPV